MPDVIRTVGRYEIVREVGRGGMAVVYLARQTDLDRFVALKELAAFHASDPTFARRFVRESRLAASLSHPNIVTVHEYFEHGGVPYIAMEYVDRGSLRPHVSDLGLAQVAGVLEGMFAGLAHAETRGVVHRDLKPENLMITEDGRVKIADFGIAKARGRLGTNAMLTVTGMTVGTPTYMAPEQAMAMEIGPWTDLYSTGCMAFEMLCQRPPFEGGDTPLAVLMRHVNEPPPAPRSLNPSIDPALSAWVERLLAKDPKDRTPSATEAWEDLEEIVIATLGPRWRREARLIDRGPAVDTLKPLTPAPFESTHTPTPTPGGQPAAAPETDDGFESFHLDAAGAPAGAPAPDAPAPPAQSPEGSAPAMPASDAPTPEPSVPEPPASDAPASAEPTPAEPAPAEPVSEEPAPAGPVPDAPAPADAAEEAAPPDSAQDAPPTTDPGDVSQFVTFRGSLRGRTPPAEETPPPTPPPEVPVGPALEPPATPPEPVVAAAAPVPPVQELEATIAPRSVPEAPAEVAPAAPRPAGPSLRWGRIGALAAVAAALGLVGYLVAPAGDPERAAPPPLTAAVSSKALELRHPASLKRVSSVSWLGGVNLSDRVALGPTSGAGAAVVAGRGHGDGPTLLPGELLDALGDEPPKPQRVRLGELTALRYQDLRPSDSGIALQVYAVPTTDGVATVACGGPPTAVRAFAVQCERIAATLRPRGARPFAPGPDPAYAKTLGDVFGGLRQARAKGRSALAQARRPASVARPAGAIGRAYEAAAKRLRGLAPSAWDASTNGAIADALTRAGKVYGRLASAARGNDRGRYADVRRDVGPAERGVERAATDLKTLGYEVGP